MALEYEILVGEVNVSNKHIDLFKCNFLLKLFLAFLYTSFIWLHTAVN